MNPIRQVDAMSTSRPKETVASAVPEPPAPPAEAPGKARGKKPKQERVTFYAPLAAVEYLDDLLYLASKRGSEMKIRDRTHIVRALVEAFRLSGHGLGSCCTEEELLEALTQRLSR